MMERPLLQAIADEPDQDEDLRATAADFQRCGILRTELSADVLWFLTGPWAFRRFTGGRGWDPDACEQWLADTSVSQLLPT